MNGYEGESLLIPFFLRLLYHQRNFLFKAWQEVERERESLRKELFIQSLVGKRGRERETSVFKEILCMKRP
jgi:hypothetical protein